MSISKDFCEKLHKESPNYTYIIEQAHAKGMLVALNPSPIDDALMNSDLSKVTYFIMNEVEAAAADIDGNASIDTTDYIRVKGAFLGTYKI